MEFGNNWNGPTYREPPLDKYLVPAYLYFVLSRIKEVESTQGSRKMIFEKGIFEKYWAIN